MPKVIVARGGKVIFECKDASELEKRMIEGEITLDDHWWAEGESTTWKTLREDMPANEAPQPLPSVFNNKIHPGAFKIPGKCPKCSSMQQKAFKMIYNEGTTDSFNIGFVGDDIAVSAGRKRTVIAAKFQPPEDPERGKLMKFVVGSTSPKAIEEYQEALLRWQNSWCCMQCGCTYFCINDPKADDFTRFVILNLNI